MLATNSPVVAISNEVQSATGISLPVVDPKDPVEQALHQLMVEDDAATDDVDKMIRENDAFAAQGAGVPKAELNRRILARFDVVRKGYQDFLGKHPDSARGHLAYGTFLNDLGEEEGAAAEYEKSRQLDPTNPAVWNDLANYYGEFSPVTNAFAYYAKAIELNPTEPVYYQNFATTVYLFRHDATNYFNIQEAQVFDKALDLYRQGDWPAAGEQLRLCEGVFPEDEPVRVLLSFMALSDFAAPPSWDGVRSLMEKGGE